MYWYWSLLCFFQLMDLLVPRKCLLKSYFPGMNKFSMGFIVFNLLLWFFIFIFMDTYLSVYIWFSLITKLCLCSIHLSCDPSCLLFMMFWRTESIAIDFSYDLFVCFGVLLEVLWSNKVCFCHIYLGFLSIIM